MPFILKPAEAFTIDFSRLEDVENERLMITFSHGETLLFKAQPAGNDYVHPWLLLDQDETVNSGVNDGRKLVKQLSSNFYLDNVARSSARRTIDWIRRRFDSRYYIPFKGWTRQQVEQELRIELHVGNDSKPSSLCLGRLLQIEYGTQYSNPAYTTVPWGYVVSFKNYTVSPQAVSAVTIVA